MRVLIFKIGFGVTLVVFLAILSRCLGYLYNEFVVPSHVYISEPKQPEKFIPKHIHQVFFLRKGPTIPEHFLEAQASCLEINRSYNYTLWTEPMIEEFVQKHYPDIWDLYNGYGRWVSRTNVGRYLVIHHYGGWYMDMDTQCHRSLDEIRDHAMDTGKSFVVRQTDPAGISNDFFGGSARHPFIEDVLSALPNSNRWFIFPYATNVFSCGTTFFWGRMLNYNRPEQFYMLEDFKTYFEPLHASTWHEWDGKVLVYFYTHPVPTYALFLTVIVIFILLVQFIYCRSSCNLIEVASNLIQHYFHLTIERFTNKNKYIKLALSKEDV